MDIFSHALWAGIAGRAWNQREDKRQPWGEKVNVYWMMFWGAFPDLFAFSIPFAWSIYHRILGDIPVNFGPPRVESGPSGGLPMMDLAHQLYQYSHSLIVFGLVFGLVWAFRKRPPLMILGWLLHIICDIPTHTHAFFPTPLFWPISSVTFSGFSWGQPWFLFLDVGSLLVVFLWLRRKK